MFTEIQRSYWRESTFLWAETMPEKKSDKKVGSCEPALTELSKTEIMVVDFPERRGKESSA